MEKQHKENSHSKNKKNKNIKNEDIEKVSDDYCIINGEKIEGNACSTILNDK